MSWMWGPLSPSVPPIIMPVESGTDWWANAFGLIGAVLTGVIALLGLLLAEKHHREGRMAADALRASERSDAAKTVIHTLMRSLSDAADGLPNLAFGTELSCQQVLDDFAAADGNGRLVAMDLIGRDLLLETRYLRDSDVEALVRSLAGLTRHVKTAVGLFIIMGARPERDITAGRILDLLETFQGDCARSLSRLEDYLANPAVGDERLREQARHMTQTVDETRHLYSRSLAITAYPGSEA